MTRDVVLVPGLWMPAAAMALLARRMARAGYVPHTFRYSGRTTHDANVERLARWARDTLRGRAAHYVGQCRRLGAADFAAGDVRRDAELRVAPKGPHSRSIASLTSRITSSRSEARSNRSSIHGELAARVG